MLKSIITVSLPALFLFFSCNSSDANKEQIQQPVSSESSTSPETPSVIETPTQADAIQIQPQATPQPSASPVAAGSVFHYICPNKCVGGGSEGQGKCPVCKTDLVHNDAFHNQPAQQPQNNQIQLNSQTQTPPAPAQEAPQNAKGVWHYICPKGCAGGGGQSIACTNCGTQMEHNQKYHE